VCAAAKPLYNRSFTSNTGATITSSLTIGTSLILPPLGAAIRNATGYNSSMITVLSYGDLSTSAEETQTL
jgi:hypothetical protein